MQGLRVLIFGVGSFGGGIGAARFFAEAGARVTLTDRRPASELERARTTLRDHPIERWVLGTHEEDDFRTTDWVVVNPAVPPGNPLLGVAEQYGRVVVTEMELFLRWCPTRHVAGITGSNGKSTTTQLAHDMVRASGLRTHLGGNIGRSLLPEIGSIHANDRVLLELSSFQLARLSLDTPRPRVAALTQFAPNHLDWHGDETCYLEAKESILDGEGIAVLPAHDLKYQRWCTRTKRQTVPFAPFRHAGCNSFDGNDLILDDDCFPVETVLRGAANRANVACAATVAKELGASPEGIQQALGDYRALPHRQEYVSSAGGITFVNDSKATTPEATLTALEAFAPNCIVLVGGSSKGTDCERLADGIREHGTLALTYGSTGPEIAAALNQRNCPHHAVHTLDEAFAHATDVAVDGDTVLLSPACASYDQFQSYEQRGERFRDLVRAWVATRSVT